MLHNITVLKIKLYKVIMSAPALIPKRVALRTASAKIKIVKPATVH